MKVARAGEEAMADCVRPMWKPEHRRAADRNDLRYPSDLTDAEWALVEPLIPPGRHGGRKRSVNVREVLNGIFHSFASQ
jgi:hypothetical protein